MSVSLREKTHLSWEAFGLGVFASTVALITGYVLVMHYGIILGDSMSRVMNAYYVFFKGTPHLAAIGFIWNPLPSLLELPFTLLHHVWPILVTRGFAGNLVTAAFAGVGAYQMNRIFFQFKLPIMIRVIWTLLFLLNPLILFYSANGMSDIMLISCLVAATRYILLYCEVDNLNALVTAALWLAVAFLIRYEAVPFSLFIGLALAFTWYRQRRPLQYIEANLLILALPITYAGMLWMFANWLIMKNPLYFLLSPYGNAAQIATGSYTNNFSASTPHHLVQSVWVAIQFGHIFLPVFPLFIIVFILLWRTNADSRAPVLLAATFGVSVLQIALMYMGKTAIWERFFMEYIPAAFIMAAFLTTHLQKRLRATLYITLTVVLVYGNWTTWIAMNSTTYGNGDVGYVYAIKHNQVVHPFTEAESVAKYIEVHPHSIVLMDTFEDYAIVAQLRDKSQAIITSDLNFSSVLEQPKGRVTAFLVPEPLGVAKLDAINVLYPHLWAEGATWTRLIKSFPGPHHYRLYAIGPNAP